MADTISITLTLIARDHDRAGRHRQADAADRELVRLAQQSAVGNWWNGVQQIGQSIGDIAGAAGNAVAAPFESAGQAANAAWNTGIKNMPQAAGQALQQSTGQAQANMGQAAHDFSQGATAVQGPNGTGLPGAAATDATHGFQNAAQGYIGGLVNQQMTALQQSQQDQYITNIVQQAVQAHEQNGTGWWTIINNAIQFGSLTPINQQKLKQQFMAATPQAPPAVSSASTPNPSTFIPR